MDKKTRSTRVNAFTIKGKTYSLVTDGVSDIYLFGSVLRGEEDIYSDIDLLFIVDNLDDQDISALKNRCSNDLAIPIDDLTFLTKDRIERGLACEEMFLWTIKTDHRVLFSRDGYLHDILDQLRVFKKKTLVDEIASIEDFIWEYRDFSITSNGELKEVLGAIIYSLKSLCSCALVPFDDITFNKYKIVDRCIGYLNGVFPFDYDEYTNLINVYNSVDLTKIDYLGYEDFITRWITRVLKVIEITNVLSSKSETYDFVYRR